MMQNLTYQEMISRGMIVLYTWLFWQGYIIVEKLFSQEELAEFFVCRKCFVGVTKDELWAQFNVHEVWSATLANSAK